MESLESVLIRSSELLSHNVSVPHEMESEFADGHPQGVTVEEKEAEAEDDGEDDEDDEDDDMDDADAEAQAEEIARRLGDQLWADISKAQADRAGAISSSFASDIRQDLLVSGSLTTVSTLPNNTSIAPVSISSKKVEAALTTMKTILACSENDALARSMLAMTIVPDSQGHNVLDLFTRSITTGDISKDTAKHLSQVLVSLAKSEILFSRLRHSNASAIQLDKGKRKRELTDDGAHVHIARHMKRPYSPQADLQTQLNEAVRIVQQALHQASAENRTIDPSLVSSVSLQLHQLFLFAVTASARNGPSAHILQEISGLIQVIGVVSGIQIAPPSSLNTLEERPSHIPMNAASWSSMSINQVTITGTAVYPCLLPPCKKIFSRLYSLRAHQRSHALHRPYCCSFCKATFARSHDLKRHERLHDAKAWKCCGCDKIFSRRDAIKRHKDSAKSREKNLLCTDAEVKEVELEKEEREQIVKEGRRARLWDGFAANQSNVASHAGPGDEGVLEEGEVRPEVMEALQAGVISLHPLLRILVTGALGESQGQVAPTSSVDSSSGQLTLASVIARAQFQNLLPRTAEQRHPDASLQAPSYIAATSQTPLSVDQPHGPAANDSTSDSQGVRTAEAVSALSLYGLSDEQTKLLEEAIANAASAAQAQAEAEAALEEEEAEEEYGEEDEDSYEDRGKSESKETTDTAPQVADI